MSGKEKDQGNDMLHCFGEFIRSLSVPSAPLQQGPFSVREYSDQTTAFMMLPAKIYQKEGRLYGELRAGGLFACQH